MALLWVQQLRALLWKSWVVRKRHYITTIFEILIPISLVCLIAYAIASIRQDIPKEAGRFDTVEAPQDGDVEPPTSYPTVFDSLVDLQKVQRKDVFYAPNNDATKRFVAEMNNVLFNMTENAPTAYFLRPEDEDYFLQNVKGINFTGFDTEFDIESLIDRLSRQRDSDPSNDNSLKNFAGAIIFNSLPNRFSRSNKSLHYTLRVNGLGMRSAGGLWTPKYEAGPSIDTYSDYTGTRSKFAQLQILVNQAFLNLKSQDLGIKPAKDTNRIQIRVIPYPSYRRGSKWSVVNLVPTAMIIGFAIAFPTLVKRITDEKSSQSRELLRMMGLSDWVYWLAHFVSSGLFFIPISIIMLAILFSSMFVYSSFGPLAVLFTMYSINISILAFLVSILFQRPVVSVAIAVIVWQLINIPTFVLDSGISRDYYGTGRTWSCLLPNSALTWAIRYVAQKENMGEGIQWYNMNDQNTVYGKFTFLRALAMMLFSSLLMSFLVWYLDNVWPWQPGVPKPFYFLFTRSYWFPKGKSLDDDNSASDTSSIDNHSVGRLVSKDKKFFEPVDNAAPVAIRLSNVTKVYENIFGHSKVAVDNVSFDVLRDEITCLLGHNGAGKTTTMNMMTGMFPATRGTITITGYNIAKETRKARESMSLCPQNNPLYPELTVAEHLFLYGAVKGFPWKQLTQEVAKTVAEVKLDGHANKMAPQLSGGMKRKLCLGIALVGDTKILVLDEPTSGLDTEVRRSIWDLLRTARKTRTILLSTHDMEEADALSDRIVIMSEGQVACAGSPMFLKKVFGTGYTLRVVKKDNFSPKSTMDLIEKYFPYSKLKSNVGQEISFSLESQPNATDPSRLPPFFREIEEQKEYFGIDTFGLSVTSLEEVFLKVDEMMLSGSTKTAATGKDDASTSEEARILPTDRRRVSTNSVGWSSMDSLPSTPILRLKGCLLEMQRIRGLCWKRFQYGKRFWPMSIFQIVIPGLLFLFCFAISNYIINLVDEGAPLKLSLPDLYGKTTVFFSTSDPKETLGDFYETVAKKSKQSYQLFNKGTGRSLNDYLVKLTGNMTLNDFVSQYLVGAHIEQQGESKVVTAWSSNEASFALPLSLDFLYKTFDLEMMDQNGDADKEKDVFDLSASLHFIEGDGNVVNQLNNAKTVALWFWMFMIPITVPSLAASYCLFPIHERSSKSKLLQLMTGLHPFLLHTVNFVFDFILHILAIVVILLVFLVMDSEKIWTRNISDFFSLFLLLVIFGFSAIAYAYVASNFIAKPSSGFTLLMMIYLITGLIFSITIQILQLLQRAQIVATTLVESLTWIFSISPIFSMTRGFQRLYGNGIQHKVCDEVRAFLHDKNLTLTTACDMPLRYLYDKFQLVPPCCPNICQEQQQKIIELYGEDVCELSNPIQWRDAGIGKELFMLFISFLLGVLILFIVEKNWSVLLRKFLNKAPLPPDPTIEDDDVRREKERVAVIGEARSYASESLVAEELTKWFGNNPAVCGLSFTVHHREIFGLLGVNGAGKTTTFRMITGDLVPSFGDCHQENLSITHDKRAYQQRLGYCPQFDPLLDRLTGKEMLYLFGRLRGLEEQYLPELVERLIKNTGLEKYANNRTDSYSGGNKRKLSLAIALIAYPSVILLDEPTAGVDPGARRKIWKIISSEVTCGNSSVVLTSHSMDECETLCSRLSIMVAGRMRCLGSPQEIKSKYGHGYTVMLKFKLERVQSDPTYLNSVKETVMRLLPGVIFTDCHETVWTLRVPDSTVNPDMKWSTVFERMQFLFQDMDLEDYSVSDTTLEQVFVSFARNR